MKEHRQDHQHLYFGGPIFNGVQLLDDHVALFERGLFKSLIPVGQADTVMQNSLCKTDLAGDIFSIGYVDVQVNGGGGVMLNDAPTVETLDRMATAHRSLGATAILPTLITDRPERTKAAIFAAHKAISSGTSGIAGLHLEGPHISVARKGAHDPRYIRPMEQEDLLLLLQAADLLPALMVTVAPESVTRTQVQRLAEAGVIVSLGHSNADFATCCDYIASGGRCVTHLFNAMSQFGHREPGLVGAALLHVPVAGLIADGVHVHPTTMRLAWKAMSGEICLVSDAMAVAATDLTEFELNGWTIKRQNGRLMRDSDEDQTPILAGADLDLTTALRVLKSESGLALDQTLPAATSIPARLIGRKALLDPNYQIKERDCIRIASDLSSAHPVIN